MTRQADYHSEQEPDQFDRPLATDGRSWRDQSWRRLPGSSRSSGQPADRFVDSPGGGQPMDLNLRKPLPGVPHPSRPGPVWSIDASIQVASRGCSSTGLCQHIAQGSRGRRRGIFPAAAMGDHQILAVSSAAAAGKTHCGGPASCPIRSEDLTPRGRVDRLGQWGRHDVPRDRGRLRRRWPPPGGRVAAPVADLPVWVDNGAVQRPATGGPCKSVKASTWTIAETCHAWNHAGRAMSSSSLRDVAGPVRPGRPAGPRGTGKARGRAFAAIVSGCARPASG